MKLLYSQYVTIFLKHEGLYWKLTKLLKAIDIEKTIQKWFRGFQLIVSKLGILWTCLLCLQVQEMEARSKEKGYTVLVPFVSLDTPGKATVRVVILADPVCRFFYFPPICIICKKNLSLVACVFYVYLLSAQLWQIARFPTSKIFKLRITVDALSNEKNIYNISFWPKYKIFWK